ncbi:isochorismatase family protein [Rhodococcus sp. HM1]|uniref:isochorismatase family protein n=1 Tax=Rhodococcus sp. HM1 TaxID=2937759 RepID=UPI00200A475F|nr:isochorismatase family protein [Rhodococcus sp. HM1]MCK8671553.1 isochorismatase family protein [Rhodococcus sp. HM1]
MHTATDLQVLFADIQPDHLPLSATNAPDTITRSASVLARVARLLEIPVTSSVLASSEHGNIPEIAVEHPDTCFPRLSPCALLDDTTRKRLEANNRPILVLGGIATEIVVLHTGLEALAAGYQVHLPVDLCGGLSARTEQAALRQLEKAGAHLTSVPSLCTGVIRDFTVSPDQDVLKEVLSLL